jgi:DNA-binding NarL/FixJ family response regulator
MRVLIADDHALLREKLKSILQSHGYEVCGEAADGRDAVRRARKCKPDVLVLDITMPVMNGLDAAREIHRERPDLPVILISMHSFDYQNMAGNNSGIRGFVSKSDAADDLIRAIEAVTSGGTYFPAVACRV